ncbi:hypothetical protein [uncultured Methanobrevibacter sp.]|uniref:DUF11 domain-containing protein n=1 Tax=uncultured Methanobrevibacter sp. TaxID=253161 RepID=UPI0025FC4F2D|nr:hypothetical protein [uncultured Methanobrevibacter sp.]
MLENKIAISKNFLIAICFISFVLFAVNTVNAIELNDTSNTIDMIGSEANGGINAIDLDKLGNSQEDVLSQSNTVTLNNGKFSDIQNLINNNLNDGDTLILNGVFTTDTSESPILVYKNITFTSTSTATFDAKHLTGIFVVENGGSGSSFSNFIFKNAYAKYGSAIYIFGKDVVIEKCLFQDNYASMGGGAIYTNYYIDQNPDYGRNLMIKDCGFMNNGAKLTAGAVGAYGYNVRILNCLFDSNSVYDSDGGEVYGGALQIGREEYVTNSVVKNCKFIRNKAISRSGSQLSHGGASCIRDGVTFENCLFEENSADHGGALTTHCSATIKNCTFKSNTANKYGGAISNMDKINSQNLRIIDCDFSSNNAPYGGAVKLAGYSVAIDDCNFDDNYASIDGGAVYIDTNTLDVTNSNFNYNDAEHNGGAVYVNGKSTNIKESYFRHNTAIANPNVKNDGLGGAIYINGTLDTINNNIFEYNVARNGSAIYYDKSGKDLKITNNVMTKNQAWVYALPIYARDIYYGETERIGAVIYGGNNIGDYDNLAVSNAIYNAAPNRYIKVNGETPVYGATNSGQLYQDAREYNIDVLLTVKHSDGTVVYNKTLKSSYLGEVSDVLSNLKVGTYTVTAKHLEDNYYKAITNQTTFVVKSHVDVAVSKDTNYETYNYHDRVVWTINVVNNGPNDATGVKVNDVLPSGLVYQSYSASVGTYSNGVWNIGNLAKGASATLKLTTLINKTGDIINTANIVANEFDWNMTNNKDSQKVSIPKAADLSITKQSNVTNANLGDLVKWTLTVRNNGPDVDTNVVVSDILPAGLIFKSSNGNYADGKWSVGTLNVGQSRSLEIITLVNTTGFIINTATVTGEKHDYNLANNKASKTINVAKAADLKISKSVNNTSPAFGSLVRWTLTVTNLGSDAASGVRVSDVLPVGLIYQSSTASVGSYANGVWSVGNLAKGGSVTLNIVCKVNKTGSIKNVASVTGNEFDINKNNNLAESLINVSKAADLSINKVVIVSNPNYGDLVRWTLTVRNNGPDAATNVVVTDVLPVGLIFKSSNGNYVNGKWAVGNLNVGQSRSLEIIALVNVTGSIVNTATVTGNEYDYNLNNNKVSKTINVPKAADLSINKVVNVSNPNYGDLVRWTLTVRNNGPDNATEVTVGDIIPQGLVFISSNGSYVDGKWSVGTLNVGQSRSLEIVTLVNITGNIINKANVSGKEYDCDLSNNNASKSIYVPKAADLSINKVVNVSNPNYLDLVKWTLTVRNIGPDSASNVTVSDILPAGLIYQSYSASIGSYINGIWYIGNLAKGDSVTLNIVCKVNKTGSITNVASVTATEYDINKTNNNDNESIDVPNAADLEIKKLVNNSSPNYHQYVKWSIVVKNNGPDDAHGVFVEDILPECLVVMAANGDYDGKKWNIGTLNAFSSKTLEITTLVNKTGLLINNANVSADEYDYNESNNKDNSSINVPPSSDLEISKMVSTPTPLYNENIKWLIIVKNNGPDKATDVKVDELLPDAFELVRSIASKGYYINGIWSIGDLNIGEIVNLEIITKVVKTGNFTNNVIVTSNEYDYNKSNNEANKSVKVYPAIDLEITKKVNNTSPNYYNLVKWSITVRNNGPDNATQIEITDILPKGLELVSYNSSKGFYSDGFWKFCCLNVGETQTLDIITRIKAIGEIKNVVTANANEYDYDSHNNRDELVINVAPSSDLEVTKNANQSVVNYKDLVKWTLVVKNNGPSDATRVFVLDSLPEGLTFISAQGDGSYSTVGTWYVGNIASGQTRELTIVSRADKTGEFNNVAVVRSDQYDYNPSNDKAEKTVIVPPAADLAITKTVSKLQYAVGDLISYAIEVTNNGPDMAKDINVTEIKDDALEFKSVFAASGFYDDVNDMWHIESLPNGEKASLYIDAVSTKEGLISNKVSVISKTFDYNMLNNYAESIVEIIKKIIDQDNPFNPGTYSKVRANEFEIGDFDNIAKANIEMRETGLPVGLLFIIALISVAFCGSNISKKR